DEREFTTRHLYYFLHVTVSGPDVARVVEVKWRRGDGGKVSACLLAEFIFVCGLDFDCPASNFGIESEMEVSGDGLLETLSLFYDPLESYFARRCFEPA